jgi:hypothetical protein
VRFSIVLTLAMAMLAAEGLDRVTALAPIGSDAWRVLR